MLRQGSGRTYPPLSGRLPAPVHDVPDFAHATSISVGHALPVRTPVTVSKKAIPRPMEQFLLDGRRRGERAPVLGCHVNVQRRQSAVVANRFFPSGACARAVETGPACPRARRSELSGRRRSRIGVRLRGFYGVCCDTLNRRNGNSSERRQRRNHAVRIAQDNAVVADGVIEVRCQTVVVARCNHARRQIEVEGTGAIQRPRRLVLPLEHRIFNTDDGSGCHLAEARLVIPTNLKSPSRINLRAIVSLPSVSRPGISATRNLW